MQKLFRARLGSEKQRKYNFIKLPYSREVICYIKGGESPREISSVELSWPFFLPPDDSLGKLKYKDFESHMHNS